MMGLLQEDTEQTSSRKSMSLGQSEFGSTKQRAWLEFLTITQTMFQVIQKK